MNNKYDAIVIGGGYVGCAVAYRLSRAGVKTVLLEKNEVGSGASGGNFGNVQVQDASMGLSLELTVLGASLMRQMEEELGESIGYRDGGDVVVAEKESHIASLEERYRNLINAGLKPELLTQNELEKREPNLRKGSLYGALYYRQGTVYPFWYIYAMINAGRRFGLTVREHANVKELYMKGGVCCGAVLSDESLLHADHVVVAAGPGTHEICCSAGLEVPVKTVKAEALVTEPVESFLHHTFSSAAFFSDAHDEGACNSSLCIVQSLHGNILIGETTKGYDLVNPENRDCTSSFHCAKVAEHVKKYFPALETIKVIRSYTTSSPYTDNCLPVFGKTSVKGILTAAGFKSTVVMTPVAGRIITDLITKDRSDYDLSVFNQV